MLRRHYSIMCVCVCIVCMQLCYDSNFLEKVLAKMARECQSRGRAEISAAVLEYAGKIELCNRCLLPPSHALTKLTSHTHIHTDICTYTRIQCLLTLSHNCSWCGALYGFTYQRQVVRSFFVLFCIADSVFLRFGFVVDKLIGWILNSYLARSAPLSLSLCRVFKCPKDTFTVHPRTSLVLFLQIMQTEQSNCKYEWEQFPIWPTWFKLTPRIWRKQIRMLKSSVLDC